MLITENHENQSISAFHGDLNYVCSEKISSSLCDFQQFSMKGINHQFPIHCRRKRSSKHEGAGGSGGGSSSMGLGHVEAFWDCPGVATNSIIFCFLSVEKVSDRETLFSLVPPSNSLVSFLEA